MKRIITHITLFLLLPIALLADPLAENQARVGVIAGDVGLLSQGASEWIEPHEGLPIEPGDHIRTGEDSRVELIMGENVLWTLEPETEVVTEHMEINTGRLNLTSGTLLGKVDSARAAGVAQRWEFNTPMAVAAVRGTEFALEFSPPLHLGGSADASVADKTEGTHLGVFEGTVEMQLAETAEGVQPPVRVNAGQEAVAASGKPLKTMVKFSAPMQLLAAKKANLERRQSQIQNTWSPFTTATRAEARKKYVAAPPKRLRVRPHPPRTRRKPQAASL